MVQERVVRKLKQRIGVWNYDEMDNDKFLRGTSRDEVTAENPEDYLKDVRAFFLG